MKCNVFITSAIAPHGSNQFIQKIRLEQTVFAINLLKRFNFVDNIVIVDNTDFRNFPRIHNVIYNTFRGDFFAENSKSLGELEIYRYAISESILPESFIKLSGRYALTNFDQLAASMYSYSLLLYRFYPSFLEYRKYYQTSVFKCTIDQLAAFVGFCDQNSYTNKLVLERSFHVFFSKQKLLGVKIKAPIFEGVRGDGKSLQHHSFPYNFFRHLHGSKFMADAVV